MDKTARAAKLQSQIAELGKRRAEALKNFTCDLHRAREAAATALAQARESLARFKYAWSERR